MLVAATQTSEFNQANSLTQKRWKQKTEQTEANHSSKDKYRQAELDEPIPGGPARPEARLGRSVSTELVEVLRR
jgi:hypothetical protein